MELNFLMAIFKHLRHIRILFEVINKKNLYLKSSEYLPFSLNIR